MAVDRVCKENNKGKQKCKHCKLFIKKANDTKWHASLKQANKMWRDDPHSFLRNNPVPVKAVDQRITKK